MFSGKTQNVLPLAVLLAIASSLFYFSACRFVYWQDAALYPVALIGLSNTIPPGFPVYMMFGLGIWITSMTEAIFALNLLSALAAIVTVGLVWITTQELGFRFGGVVARWGATLAALIWLSCPTLRDESTTCEVYSLSLAFQAGLIWMLARYARLGEGRVFLLSAFAFGLLLGIHPQPIFLLPFWLLFVFLMQPHKSLRFLPLALVLFVLAFSTHLYLPFRSLVFPANDWGHPRDWERFYFHITAGQFGFQMFSSSWAVMWDRAIQLGSLIRQQWGEIGIAMVLGSYILITTQNWRNLFLIILPAIVASAIALTYPSYGFRAWHLPLYLSMALSIGYTWSWLMTRFSFSTRGMFAVSISASIIIIGYTVFTQPHFYRQDYRLADDAGRNLLTTLPLNATTVMTMAASEGFSQMAAIKTVYNLRPDVEIYDFTGNGFYRDVPNNLGITPFTNIYLRMDLLTKAEDELIAAHPEGVFYTYPEPRLEDRIRLGEWGLWYYTGSPRERTEPWDYVKWTGYTDWKWRLDTWAQDFLGNSFLAEGLARLAKGDERGAGLISEAVDLGKQSPIVAINLADQYMRRSEFPTALFWAEHSLELDPTDPDTYRLIIRISQLMGETNLMQQYHNQARLHFPDESW